jgi:hypothetical protein
MGLSSERWRSLLLETELRAPESAVSGALRTVSLPALSVGCLPRSIGGGFAIPDRMSSVFANASR